MSKTATVTVVSEVTREGIAISVTSPTGATLTYTLSVSGWKRLPTEQRRVLSDLTKGLTAGIARQVEVTYEAMGVFKTLTTPPLPEDAPTPISVAAI